MDVAAGRDLHQTEGLVVIGRPASASSRGHQVSEFKEFTLILSSPEIMIDAGGRVEGRLEFLGRKMFSVKDIRVELERTERAGMGKLTQAVEKITLQGPAKIAPNQLLQWPFSFNMPSGSVPSVATVDTNVVWKAKGVVPRTLSADLVVEQEIQVFNSQ